MAFDIRLPNTNGNTEAEQLYQIKCYLYQLAQDLKYNLNTLEVGTSDESSIKRSGIIDSLENWKLNIDKSYALINSAVAKNQASISLLVSNGQVNSKIIVEAINNESVAKISADRLDIVGKKLNIKVDATNISGTLTAEQIKVNDLNAFGATIGGFTIDNNSIHSQMGTNNRILLCSGTSASYKVGDFTSTGWAILAGANFGVLKDGTMHAQNAHISGTLTTGATADDKEYGLQVGDGFIHINKPLCENLINDSGETYLLMKFNTGFGHTWGLFVKGPYATFSDGSVDVDVSQYLYVERLDKARA